MPTLHANNHQSLDAIEDVSMGEPNGVTVLVADDDPVARSIARTSLSACGYRFLEAADGSEVAEKMHAGVYVALLDIRMPQVSGFDCVREIKERFPDTHVVMVTASDDVSDAVQAIKAGASDYVVKPLEATTLQTLVRQGVRISELAREQRSLRYAAACSPPPTLPVTKSRVYGTLLHRIERLSSRESTVLLRGESGTGKTSLARAIHQESDRASQPFVAVHCAALPRELMEVELFGSDRHALSRPGRIELADGGTLFLDEIGELPLELQPRLLSFLQTQSFYRVDSNTRCQVDVRVVATTNQQLYVRCQEKKFLEGLYYHLNAAAFTIPPLRDHPEDVEPLALEIVERIARRLDVPVPRIEEEAIEEMKIYSWPGNIRETESVLERAMTFARHRSVIAASDLDLATTAPVSAEGFTSSSLVGLTLKEIEKIAIEQTLRSCRGNKAMTARRLGISEKSIYNKLKRHGIFAPPKVNRFPDA